MTLTNSSKSNWGKTKQNKTTIIIIKKITCQFCWFVADHEPLAVSPSTSWLPVHWGHFWSHTRRERERETVRDCSKHQAKTMKSQFYSSSLSESLCQTNQMACTYPGQTLLFDGATISPSNAKPVTSAWRTLTWISPDRRKQREPCQ